MKLTSDHCAHVVQWCHHKRNEARDLDRFEAMNNWDDERNVYWVRANLEDYNR